MKLSKLTIVVGLTVGLGLIAIFGTHFYSRSNNLADMSYIESVNACLSKTEVANSPFYKEIKSQIRLDSINKKDIEAYISNLIEMCDCDSKPKNFWKHDFVLAINEGGNLQLKIRK